MKIVRLHVPCFIYSGRSSLPRTHGYDNLTKRFFTFLSTRNLSTSNTMYHNDYEDVKAAVCTSFNEPLKLSTRRIPTVLKADEVAIDVKYAAINFADILVCQGKYQSSLKPPFCAGIELAGTISAFSKNVKSLPIGTPVVAMSLDSLGAYSEKCVVSSQMVWPIPHGVTLQQAVCLPSSYGTMELALHRRARIKYGETIVVTAAAGSLGLAAIDIAKNIHGAKIIAACSTEEKRSYLLEHGVDDVINYKEENVRKAINGITGGRGVDIVVDTIGGPLSLELIKCLSPEGRLIVIGFTSGKIPEIPSNLLLLKNCDIIGVWLGQYHNYGGDWDKIYYNSIADVLDLCKERSLMPSVGKEFTLDEVNEAFKFVLSRKSIGKVILKV